MKATLCKRFTFDAAHCLPKLGPDHKCARLHGHTYEVEIVITGDVGDNGFVIDYDDIAKAWAPIHRDLDHRYLNEIPGLETPSTEVLCHWIWDNLVTQIRYFSPSAYLGKVRVYESSTTYCEVTG